MNHTLRVLLPIAMCLVLLAACSKYTTTQDYPYRIRLDSFAYQPAVPRNLKPQDYLAAVIDTTPIYQNNATAEHNADQLAIADFEAMMNRVDTALLSKQYQGLYARYVLFSVVSQQNIKQRVFDYTQPHN